MFDGIFTCTSLCRFTMGVRGDIPLLQRLGDVENGRLTYPYKSYDRKGNCFENRDDLYYSKGTPADIGLVGVWDWSARPREDDPENDWIEAKLNGAIMPIRIVVAEDATSIEALAKKLVMKRVSTEPLRCDTLVCVKPGRGNNKYQGLLCSAQKFTFDGNVMVISEKTYGLPVYTVERRNTYTTEDEAFTFVKDFRLSEEPDAVLPLMEPNKIVHKLLMDKLTWTYFKDALAGTKQEWRVSRSILEHIQDGALHEDIMSTMGCTKEAASAYVNNYVQKAAAMADLEFPVDADIVAQIALNHPGLRAACEQTVEAAWRKANDTRIAEAEAEFEKKKAVIEEQHNATSKKLSTLVSKVEEYESKRATIQAEVEKAQEELDTLQSLLSDEESLSKAVQERIQERLAVAREDVAAFYAELSVMMPGIPGNQSANATNDHSAESTLEWKYTPASLPSEKSSTIRRLESWKTEHALLSQNLHSALGIEGTLADMLAAFLYAAQIHQVPILLAGPCGQEIADIHAYSVSGATAGKIDLGEVSSLRLPESMKEYKDSVLVVNDITNRNWINMIPNMIRSRKADIFYGTVEYADSLRIETRGLYNLFIPLFTECFVEQTPNMTMHPGKRVNKFQALKVDHAARAFQVSTMNTLGINKVALRRLAQVCNTAKIICGNGKPQDFELLFGLLPFSLILGKEDILQDLLDKGTGYTLEVRNEVERMLTYWG